MYPRITQYYKGQFYDGNGFLIPGIRNPGSSRILISDGTSTGLIGYGNFTFDGNTLNIGNSSNSSDIIVGQNISGTSVFSVSSFGTVSMSGLITKGITGGYLYADSFGNVYATGGGGTGSGAQGPIGPTGPQGLAATIEVGTVSVTGSVPTVTNVGTSFSAIFDFTFPLGSTSGGGNLQQTLTLGNTASLGFELLDNSGNTNTFGAANITISDNISNEVLINNQGIEIGNTSSSVSIQNSSIVKLDKVSGAETVLEFNHGTQSKTIFFPDNGGTIALLTDITGGNLQQTLTSGNTSSLSIELLGGAFQASGSGGESSDLSSSGLQLIDGLNQGVVTPFLVKIESSTSYIEFNDTKITKLDPSDGRYTEIIFDQTTPGGVNTITFQDGTGTVAFLTDVVPGPIGPTGADSTVPGPTGPGLLIQREVGTFSGQDTIGLPLSYTVSFGVTFSGDYLVNVESSALRLFTVTNKNPNGFVIETNSSQLFDNVVYWQAWSFV